MGPSPARVPAGILLTTAVMLVVILFLNSALVAQARAFFVHGEAGQILFDLVLGLIGVAAAGAIGARLWTLEWQHTVISAVLFVIGFILLFQFEVTNISLQKARWMILTVPGVFLLPLFDPHVRQTGPKLGLTRILAAALAWTAVTVLVDILFAHSGRIGLFTFWAGALSSLILAVIGMLLALAGLTKQAAWLGGLGLMLFPIAIVTGRLLSSAST